MPCSTTVKLWDIQGRPMSGGLSSFDRYCTKNEVTDGTLAEHLVWGWLENLIVQKRTGLSTNASTIRIFGKYLSAIGQSAYILPDGLFVSKRNPKPYLFTDAELAALFYTVDRLPREAGGWSVIAPVLFRLIYTCGLRPNEGRELLRDNVNLNTGEMLITKTKRNKERMVVMSDDMLHLCKQYANSRNPDGFFFPANGNKPFTAAQLNKLLRGCWKAARPGVKPLPAIRVFDLRHRFASSTLNRWLDEGRDLYAMLPYLSSYMGHKTLSETAYYIHVLPENLVKSAGVDWAAFEGVIPEVVV